MSRYPGSYNDNPTRNPDVGATLTVGGSLMGDVEQQADSIASGVLSIPIEAAREMIARWAVSLRSWDDPQLSQIARSLDELSGAIGERFPEGSKVGVLLTRLGMETRIVAADRFGPLGMALDRLADGLIFAGTSLAHEIQ